MSLISITDVPRAREDVRGPKNELLTKPNQEASSNTNDCSYAHYDLVLNASLAHFPGIHPKYTDQNRDQPDTSKPRTGLADDKSSDISSDCSGDEPNRILNELVSSPDAMVLRNKARRSRADTESRCHRQTDRHSVSKKQSKYKKTTCNHGPVLAPPCRISRGFIERRDC